MVYIFKIHNINSAKTVQSQLLYISFRSLYKNAVLRRGCPTHPRLRTACSTQSFRWEKSILKNIFKILISSIVNWFAMFESVVSSKRLMRRILIQIAPLNEGFSLTFVQAPAAFFHFFKRHCFNFCFHVRFFIAGLLTIFCISQKALRCIRLSKSKKLVWLYIITVFDKCQPSLNLYSLLCFSSLIVL